MLAWMRIPKLKIAGAHIFHGPACTCDVCTHTCECTSTSMSTARSRGLQQLKCAPSPHPPQIINHHHLTAMHTHASFQIVGPSGQAARQDCMNCPNTSSNPGCRCNSKPAKTSTSITITSFYNMEGYQGGVPQPCPLKLPLPFPRWTLLAFKLSQQAQTRCTDDRPSPPHKMPHHFPL